MSPFKISLPTFSINDKDSRHLVVDSRYPNPKIDTRPNPPHAGIIRLNWASTSTIVPQDTTLILYSFPHGYNYVPTAVASHHYDDGSNRFSGTLPFQLGALGMVILDTDRTKVNLKYFSFDNASTIVPVFTMQVRYYVMAERGHA